MLENGQNKAATTTTTTTTTVLMTEIKTIYMYINDMYTYLYLCISHVVYTIYIYMNIKVDYLFVY